MYLCSCSCDFCSLSDCPPAQRSTRRHSGTTSTEVLTNVCLASHNTFKRLQRLVMFCKVVLSFMLSKYHRTHKPTHGDTNTSSAGLIKCLCPGPHYKYFQRPLGKVRLVLYTCSRAYFALSDSPGSWNYPRRHQHDLCQSYQMPAPVLTTTVS